MVLWCLITDTEIPNCPKCGEGGAYEYDVWTGWPFDRFFFQCINYDCQNKWLITIRNKNGMEEPEWEGKTLTMRDPDGAKLLEMWSSD